MQSPLTKEQIKKIRTRIRRYERLLRKEREQYGSYQDGYGKRFLIGPLYMRMGDYEGCKAYYDWFQREFPNSMGDSMHNLCWSVILYRAGNLELARKMLADTITENLYIIPHFVFLEDTQPFEFDDGFSSQSHDCVRIYEDLNPVINFTEEEIEWIKQEYNGDELQRVYQEHYESERTHWDDDEDWEPSPATEQTYSHQVDFTPEPDKPVLTLHQGSDSSKPVDHMPELKLHSLIDEAKSPSEALFMKSMMALQQNPNGWNNLRENLRQAIAMAKDEGNALIKARAQCALAIILGDFGDPEEAVELYQSIVDAGKGVVEQNEYSFASRELKRLKKKLKRRLRLRDVRFGVC